MSECLKVKRPDSKLDYIFDWAGKTNGNCKEDWLATGEVISNHTITASDGITIDSSVIINSGTSVQVWVSGGKHGVAYTIRCRIETNNVPVREDARDMILRVDNNAECNN